MLQKNNLYSKSEKKMDIKNDDKIKIKLFNNIIIMILIMLVCTAISMLFKYIKLSESNIVMIYLLGILLFSYLAEGYLYSFFASIFAVLVYNFFFTEPYLTLKVNNPEYFITFLVLFTVGFITSMLTNRVKLEKELVKEREEYISALYYIEKRLLNVKSVDDLAKVTAEEIAKQLNSNVLVEFFSPSGNKISRNIEGEDVFQGNIDNSACLESYQSGSPCGYGTTLFSEANALYTPILSQNGVLGVVGISMSDHTVLTNAQRSFIDVIAPQIAVVLERERIYAKQQKAQMEIQAERLRSDMLRSISHDLRTPLASIMGLASTSLDNYDKVNDEIKKNFLQSIYEDADWLNELVENILQTTRFEEGRVKLNIEQEAAEEIITEAVTHVKKHARNHKIIVNIPDEIILVQVDGVLIRQVIINLLNNAINYTPEKSEIVITLFREENRVIFEVKDNGHGISDEELLHIFERYYHRNPKEYTKRKGMGLGLSLCKSIVEAHKGNIYVRKNEPHGTVVSFSIISDMEVNEWNH